MHPWSVFLQSYSSFFLARLYPNSVDKLLDAPKHDVTIQPANNLIEYLKRFSFKDIAILTWQLTWMGKNVVLQDKEYLSLH